MSHNKSYLPTDLYNYLLQNSLREVPLLAELRAETAAIPGAQMQIAPDQGQFMAFLIKLIKAKRVLEIGTFTGYSSLVMALALPDEGKLITLDNAKDTTEIAKRYWQKAGVQNKVEFILGPALQTLPQIQGKFDLIFVDADKTNYLKYYEICLNLLNPDGVMLFDNTFMNASVLDLSSNIGRAVHEFNQFIHRDSRVEIAMLPVSDGLTMVQWRCHSCDGDPFAPSFP